MKRILKAEGVICHIQGIHQDCQLIYQQKPEDSRRAMFEFWEGEKTKQGIISQKILYKNEKSTHFHINKSKGNPLQSGLTNIKTKKYYCLLIKLLFSS